MRSTGKLECAICRHSKDADGMRTFSTTDREREMLIKMGEKEPKSEYHCCRTCMSIVSNPVTSMSLMKGLIQVEARAQGVNADVAEKAAEKFTSKLLEKSRGGR